jgi:hypothetical protein
MTEVRRLEELTREGSLRLLAEVSLGRVVFSHRAPLPESANGARR